MSSTEMDPEIEIKCFGCGFTDKIYRDYALSWDCPKCTIAGWSSIRASSYVLRDEHTTESNKSNDEILRELDTDGIS